MSNQTNVKAIARQALLSMGLIFSLGMWAGPSFAKSSLKESGTSTIVDKVSSKESDTTKVYKTHSGSRPNNSKANSYDNLYQYLQNKIKYSKADEKAGTVLVYFKVSEDNKISDVNLKKGIGKSYDQQVVDDLKAYPEKLLAGKGNYLLTVEFNKENGLVVPNVALAK